MPAIPPRFPARATFNLPLLDALREIRNMSLAAKPSGPAERFGREFLNLDEQAFREWFPQAWWGHYSINACILRFVNHQRRHEVVSLAQSGDLLPMTEMAREGRGLIIAVGHIGVMQVLGCVLAERGTPAFRISQTGWYQHPSVDTSRRLEPDYLSQLQVKALFQLRRGATVIAAPDGGPGKKTIVGNFVGRKIPMPSATPMLARISGAPTLPCVTRWVGDELRFEFSEPLRPNAEQPEEWEAQWNQLYLDWLEAQYRDHPDITLFGNGLLKDLLEEKGGT